MAEKGKNIIVIAGPTAVGKTAIAIQLAKQLGTHILSADSRQCYRELNIGVARPSAEELSEVPHYFIASHSVTQKVDAAVFEQYALEKISRIFQNHDTAVVVGGTGLYIKTLCEGIDIIPEVPATIREEVISQYKQQGLTGLQEQLKSLDPQFYNSGEIQNPQRIMRALEVMLATGKSILYFRRGEKAKRPFNIFKIALTLPKETLHHNINSRVDNMIKMGLPDEVKSMIPYRHLNALQTVGYMELFDYLIGKSSLEEAIHFMKQHTRQYAKRQITWFKRDTEYIWFDATDMAAITAQVEKNLCK